MATRTESSVFYHYSDLLELLPHRDPMLFLDEVKIEENKEEVIALGWFTVMESHCKGHFPGKPIFPGIYLQEMALQAMAVLAKHCYPSFKHMEPRLIQADGLRWTNSVKPNDRLRAEVKLSKVREECRRCIVIGRAKIFLESGGEEKLLFEAEKLVGMGILAG